MKKREANKQKNRSQLLEAGRLVFAKKGFQAARITDITSSANLAAGTFYKYFHDKKHLFQVIVEDLTPTFRKKMQESRRYVEGEVPEQWAQRGLEAFLDITEEYPELVKLFLIQDFSFDPDFEELFREVRKGYEQDFINDMLRWVPDDLLSKQEVEIAANATISMVVSLAIRFLEDPTRQREPILRILSSMIYGSLHALILLGQKSLDAMAKEEIQKAELA